MGEGGFGPAGASQKQQEARFNSELFGTLRLNQRKPGERLGIEDSRTYLLEGNHLHVQQLREARAPNPPQRYARIEKSEADGLVIGCSDARVPALDSESPSSPLLVAFRIAGNVLPKEGTKAFEDVRYALSLVKEGGTVTFVCHCNCGAVAAKADFDTAKKRGEHPHAPPEIGALFERVHGTTPADNACKQLEVFKAVFAKEIAVKKLEVATVEYSWHAKEFMLVEGPKQGQNRLLVDQWNTMHQKVREERPKLAEEIAKQTPHAIVVAPPTLPYSIATMFKAEQNELFATNGTKDGLDVLDKASILYALEHLHARHVVFVAPGTSVSDSAIKQMFQKWQNEISAMIKSVPDLAKLLEEKKIAFTGYRYDAQTGYTLELMRS